MTDSPTSHRPNRTPSFATSGWRVLGIRLLAQLLPLAMLAGLLLLMGCSIGPTTEVRYVVMHPGQPVRILENRTVTGERLDGGGPTSVDIGGWVAMPPDHWAVVADILAKQHPAPIVPPLPATLKVTP